MTKEECMKIINGFKKEAFVPTPGGNAEPVAGASQMTAAQAGPMNDPNAQPQQEQPQGGMPAQGMTEEQAAMLSRPEVLQALQEAGIQMTENGPVDIQSGQPIPIEELMPEVEQMVQQMDAQGQAPNQQGQAQNAPTEEQNANVSIAVGDLKSLVETAVTNVVTNVMQKEMVAAIRDASKQVKQEKQNTPAPAPVAPADPAIAQLTQQVGQLAAVVNQLAYER